KGRTAGAGSAALERGVSDVPAQRLPAGGLRHTVRDRRLEPRAHRRPHGARLRCARNPMMRRGGFALLVFALASAVAPPRADVWPVEDPDQDHHVMSTLEFQDYDGLAIHSGLDIFALPVSDPTAPWVVVARDGKIVNVGCDSLLSSTLKRGCVPPDLRGCWVELLAGAE